MPGSQPIPGAESQTGSTEFSLEKLSEHRGRWVAFSPDGRRLIASSANLAELDALVRRVGEDPEEVLLERIPGDGSIRSGSELS